MFVERIFGEVDLQVEAAGVREQVKVVGEWVNRLAGEAYPRLEALGAELTVREGELRAEKAALYKMREAPFEQLNKA